jgi:hypothetical protein
MCNVEHSKRSFLGAEIMRVYVLPCCIVDITGPVSINSRFYFVAFVE